MRNPIPALCLAFVILPAGCDSGGPGPVADAGTTPPDLTPPPAICKTPVAPGAAWFTEITNDALIGPNPGALPIANTLRAGDLDGDGYADLIATAPIAERDSAMVHTRFVYMNRPSPNDPSGKTRIFVDATADSNILATRDGKGGYAFGNANLGDVDNDGDLDVVVAPAGTDWDPAGAMLNDGKGHFTLAPPSELEQKCAGFGSASQSLADLDRDGVLDYVPGTFQYPPPNSIPPMIFRGMGDGTFKEVAEMWGINVELGSFKTGTNLPSMYGVTVCDLDMDGDQDILYADYGREPNFVYRNDGGKFVEVGKMLGIASDDRLDFSDDESYRCYCKNRPGKCNPAPPLPSDDRICTGFGIGNDGRGWFPGDSDQPWRLGGNNFGIACGDLDDDGDMDLMTATIRHGDVGSCSDPSEILVNNTPAGMPLMKFTRPGNKVTGIDRVENGIFWNEGDMTPVFVDLDLDGRKDIYLTSSDYPGDHGWVWHQKADHTFEDITSASKIGQKEAHGIAFADFDHDGDIDVAIGTSDFRGGAPNKALRIYRNEVGASANFTQIELVGKGAGGTNRSAIGALVKVTAGGKTQMQEISGGHSSSTTQNELPLTFGLGATCTIDKIEVRWLDAKGTVQTWTNVRSNYRVRLREGVNEVEYLF